jgi:hypothetical protein
MANKISAKVEGRGAARKSARRTNQFIYVVLGLFVLGVLPSAPDGLAFDAQAQKADAGASATATNGGGAKKAVKVNTAPFKAFLARSKKLKDDGKLDLSRPREVVVEADRNEDGTVSNAVITGADASDPNFRKVALDFVSTLNESRALGFLDGVSRVRMNFALDAERFRLLSHADAPDETRATEMARGYRTMINVARLLKRGGDEAVILNNMKVSASGKQLVMNLDTPREAMGNLLLKQITPN